jgi:short-subunit dehydrogenase
MLTLTTLSAPLGSFHRSFRMFDYTDSTALVTGASSGLGECFAETLACRGANVVLVARSAAKLELLAKRLRAQYPVGATVITADLTAPAAPAAIHTEVHARGLSVNLLINNAGFALAGAFVDHDVKAETDQIAVNISAVTALSHHFASDMRNLGPNTGIINIASSAAFQPLPFSAVYAASKAFVLLFSEALGRELAQQGTRVLAVCPGPVKTAFWDKIGSDLSTDVMDAPEQIVQQALAAFERGKAVLVPGRASIRLQAYATRLIPRALMARLGEQASRRIMMAGHG